MTDDQHLAPVCPHCGEQDCITRTRRVVCSYGDGDLAVEGAHGRHARDHEDYLTEECAAAEERVDSILDDHDVLLRDIAEWAESANKWRHRARKWKRRAIVAESRYAVASSQAKTLGIAALTSAGELRSRMDCGQDGPVCAISPGCDVHWAERNRELLRERNEALAEVQRLKVQVSADCRDIMALTAEADALRARARGMRETLIKISRLDSVLIPERIVAAAGEPIP